MKRSFKGAFCYRKIIQFLTCFRDTLLSSKQSPKCLRSNVPVRLLRSEPQSVFKTLNGAGECSDFDSVDEILGGPAML